MRAILFVLGLLVLFSNLFAQATTCDVNAETCTFTVTMNIAFFGASDDYIANAKNEIENVWNNAGGQPFTAGECKCEFKVVVNTQKVTSCSPPPANSHCIEVTSFASNPPRATNGSTYYGYMYPPGVSTKDGLKGWWSDGMSGPAPGGGNYNDFAHEAGHMMGLEDGDGGIMSATNTGPTQANVDEVVRDVCKGKKCPDRCCCGNGVVEGGKGEQCDPVANPNGCGASDACCPYCCQCKARQCDPEAGEYGTKEECESNCKEEGGVQYTCAYSYWTGCWVCVFSGAERIDPQFSATGIREAPRCGEPIDANRTSTEKPPLAVGDVAEEIRGVPGVSYFFGNEKVNFYVEGFGDYFVVFADGEVVEAGEGELPDRTMNVYTDENTLYGLYYGEITPMEALKTGRLRYEGVGFFEGFKFWLGDLMFNMFVPYSGPREREITETVLTYPR
ncbi:hypothetical protein H0O01_05545 [Candidatus Micrarchaeota archaeon]|nr:hypothetical protein [Candidatus Micrarchaeota archaeon]